MAAPDRLIDTGPYSLSRNPMYLAWGGICLGYRILVNTWWALILLPPVLLSTHRTILRDEQRLERRFGASYARF